MLQEVVLVMLGLPVLIMAWLGCPVRGDAAVNWCGNGGDVGGTSGTGCDRSSGGGGCYGCGYRRRVCREMMVDDADNDGDDG